VLSHTQVTVQGSQTVNNIHLVIIVVEGIILTAVIVCYVWSMVQKVRVWGLGFTFHGAEGEGLGFRVYVPWCRR
jgi:hypothetical protein